MPVGSTDIALIKYLDDALNQFVQPLLRWVEAEEAPAFTPFKQAAAK
jgi:hypothetical protein